MTLEEIKTRAVLDAIERNGGSKPAAAAELGISLKTIYNMLGRMQEREASGRKGVSRETGARAKGI